MTLIHTLPILQPKTLVKLFDSIDAWRKTAARAADRPHQRSRRPRTHRFRGQRLPAGAPAAEAWEVAQSVSTKEVVAAGFKGAEIREELTRRENCCGGAVE